MSARSGVFTKYVVQFVDANFAVSNDIGAADLLIDADVTVTMARDTDGTTFTIKLYDLPLAKANSLDDALKPKTYQKLKIQLGYFETDVKLVVDGIYDKVENKMAEDKSSGRNRLVTTISGKEVALVACSDAKFTCSLSDDDATNPTKAAKSVLSEVASDRNKKDHPGIDSLVHKAVQPPGELKGKADTTFNTDTVLTALGEIAKKAKAELLVSDKTVFLGSPIKRDDVATVQLDPSTNLATIENLKLKIKPKTTGKTTGANKPDAPTETSVKGFTFTALGDPTMRPGQAISVSGLKDFASPPDYCIRNVTHQFNSSTDPTGYVCIGAAAEVLKDGAAGREIDSQIKRDGAGAAQDVASAIKSEAAKNPVIEVTSVKATADNKDSKHPYQADLYYGQARDDEQQPSIEVAIVPEDDCHVYRHRPIASPFAWRKCGLVTPVYPAMKALVAHNLGLATDGIVTGYIWSTLPDLPPPQNQPGDWWLCLPVDVDTTLLPSDQKKFDWTKFDWTKFDQTKAVNDLTASNGCRIIELKGLKITVGADGLKEIGNPPQPGEAEQCKIAHASGAVVTIKKTEVDVALNADGSGPKLTLSSSGITLTDGKLNVQLANGKLAIG